MKENCAECRHHDAFWGGSGCNLLNNGESCKFNPHQNRSKGVRIDPVQPPMTNADRIRAMTDDELVNWITDINPLYCQTCVYAKPCRLEYDVETVNYAEKYDCKDGILQWLHQPAEEDDYA